MTPEVEKILRTMTALEMACALRDAQDETKRYAVQTWAQIEHQELRLALWACGGNQHDAGLRLAIPIRSFYRLVRKHDLLTFARSLPRFNCRRRMKI